MVSANVDDICNFHTFHRIQREQSQFDFNLKDINIELPEISSVKNEEHWWETVFEILISAVANVEENHANAR